MSSLRSVVMFFVAVAITGLLAGSGCPTESQSVNRGRTIVDERCTGCHRTPGFPAALTAADADLVVNNLESISPAMFGITLTDQDVADVKAFLATQ